MIFALLTAVCWSIAGFSSSRISRAYGAAPANGLRLLLSSAILVLICIIGGYRFQHPGILWFMLSGILHLTLGDIGLFAVYRRLGPRIGVLMVTSLAPAVAILGEWFWMGAGLRPAQLICIAAILILVILAVAPKERNHLHPRELKTGILAGVAAAVMQGLSAVVTRYGYSLPGQEISPWTAAFYRVSAGAAGILFWICLLCLLGKKPLARPLELLSENRVTGHPHLWLGLSVILGPVVGIGFLMQAIETAPSGLVQATLSILPVLMIPVAWVFDGTVPSRRSLLCGAGAVALTGYLVLLSVTPGDSDAFDLRTEPSQGMKIRYDSGSHTL